MAEYNAIQQLAFKYPRTIGLVLLALSCLSLYVSFFSALFTAQQHAADEVSYSLEGFLVGVLLLPISIFIIITGNTYLRYVFMQPHQIRAAITARVYYSIMAAILLLVFAAYFFFEAYLGKLGYVAK